MRHLDVIQIDDPCPLPWDALRGDGVVRYCGTCAHNVYDLSQMSEAEAEHLLDTHEGRLCVQYYARADGTVVSADCTPSRLAQARRARETRHARRRRPDGHAPGVHPRPRRRRRRLGLPRDRRPVVAQLEEANKVLKPLEPMLPIPVVEAPPEPVVHHPRLRGRIARPYPPIPIPHPEP